MEEEDLFTGKTYGIVTNTEKWYFMEYSLDDQNRLRFKLSKLVTVVYDSGEQEIKKVRSTGNLAEKGTSSTKDLE
ncbi:hypothetical protein RirG_111910 [Rhizophagus irregularis DAOM 197198w]|uniref:Uncharacterized protein n=1 Tax=Rhizophagus irregularis (strain DAOM 197198w) TaxID=1432141 RepID=A0A015JKL6_RHIIW|nr:hypothetical protein RirG_111910 [Rhizophagus irregularis DAOM 197198w]